MIQGVQSDRIYDSGGPDCNDRVDDSGCPECNRIYNSESPKHEHHDRNLAKGVG